MKETLSEKSACFEFTEREKLYDNIPHARLLAWVQHPNIVVHEIELASNSFGEYLFVTLSCRTERSPRLLTFWGLGYHDYRERWIMDTWQWYESVRDPKDLGVMSKAQALIRIQDRAAFVQANATPIEQSDRARLYEILADMTDEDGAVSDIEDLGWALFGLDDHDSFA